jgi:hypothetical protein
MSANSVNTVYIYPSGGTAGVASVPYTSATATLTGSSSSQFGSSVD